jgi:hypothetical protein
MFVSFRGVGQGLPTCEGYIITAFGWKLVLRPILTSVEKVVRDYRRIMILSR